MSTPKTKSIPTAPGIHRVALLEPATDTAGRMWPAGTEMTPKSFGSNNEAGAWEMRYIDAQGNTITFASETP